MWYNLIRLLMSLGFIKHVVTMRYKATVRVCVYVCAVFSRPHNSRVVRIGSKCLSVIMKMI